jgi:serine/threonine-protein kinase PknG
MSDDRAGAVAAYERVPDSSSGYLDAQIARIRSLSTRNGGAEPTLDDLLAAGAILERLPIEGEPRDRLAAGLLDAALRLTLRNGPADAPSTSLLGYRLAERDLRLAAESSYRLLSRSAHSRAERIRLVDAANSVRPRTWT